MPKRSNPVISTEQHAYPPLREEIVNSITHGIGALLSVAALVILVVMAVRTGTAWSIVSFSIYGFCLLTLYLASTLYHAFPPGRVKDFFHILDHTSIYLLIAGTYTPVVLGPMRGPWGWTLFGVIWGLALAGMVLKFFFTGRFNLLSTLFYVGMGWLIVIAIKPMIIMLPGGLVVWMVIGGMSYTLGVVFYLWHKIPYHHAIWHLFVLGGSISHFIGILLYLT